MGFSVISACLTLAGTDRIVQAFPDDTCQTPVIATTRLIRPPRCTPQGLAARPAALAAAARLLTEEYACWWTCYARSPARLRLQPLDDRPLLADYRASGESPLRD